MTAKPEGALFYDEIWCSEECPHYIDSAEEYAMDMRCAALDVVLGYYDGPLAQCCFNASSEEEKENGKG